MANSKLFPGSTVEELIICRIRELEESENGAEQDRPFFVADISEVTRQRAVLTLRVEVVRIKC